MWLILKTGNHCQKRYDRCLFSMIELIMDEEHTTFADAFRFVILLINLMILSGLLLFSFFITKNKTESSGIYSGE